MTRKTAFPAAVQAKADEIMAASRARFGHDVFRMEHSTDLPSPEDMERFRTVHSMGNCKERKDLAAEAGQSALAVYALMSTLMNTARSEGRDMKASEARDYDKAEAFYDELLAIRNAYTVDYASQVGPGGLTNPVGSPTARYREGMPLAADQSFLDAVRTMGALNDAGGDDPDELSLQKYLRGALLGRWEDASSEQQVFAALSGAASADGGILLPSVLSAEIIDAARAQTRVIQAGARVVPMKNRKVTVPKWLTDPVPEWRGENDAFAEDDATMGSIELNAKGLGVVTKVSIELLEDTEIQGELEAAFARSFAQVIDLAALYADGSGDTPTGVKETDDVNVQALATNGATPTWDALVESVGRLRDVNENPNAQIMSDRTLRTLSLLKETGTGAYVQPPTYLDGITRYTTGQVPNNLTTGTAVGITSDVFTGDWSKLLIGVRSELRIFVLKERYFADAGQIGFAAHWRGDFGVTRPAAFDVVTGVKA